MNMKRMNFEYLLGALLILILSGAIAQEVGVRGETRRLFMEPALCIMLLMGVWSLGEREKMVDYRGNHRGSRSRSCHDQLFLGHA